MVLGESLGAAEGIFDTEGIFDGMLLGTLLGLLLGAVSMVGIAEGSSLAC